MRLLGTWQEVHESSVERTSLCLLVGMHNEGPGEPAAPYCRARWDRHASGLWSLMPFTGRMMVTAGQEMPLRAPGFADSMLAGGAARG